MQRFTFFLLFLMITSAMSSAIEAAAYLPHYRFKAAPGAQYSLGRPAVSPSPHSWQNGMREDNRHILPGSWQENHWKMRLDNCYSTLYIHFPLQDFLSGEDLPPAQAAMLKSFREEGHKVFLSLLGHSEQYLPIASDQEKLESFTLLLASAARRYKLSGIDIDWEFYRAPDRAESEGITRLAEAMQESLPEECMVSAALSRYRLPESSLFEYLDRVNIMAYDGYGRHSTFESAIAQTEAVIARSGIPRSRFFLGLPFYGRIFDDKSEDYYSGTKHYRDIVKSFSPLPEEDEAGGYYYNGPRTIREKTQWAAENGLGGVFVWEPFYDASGKYSLSNAIHSVVESSLSSD